MYAVFCGEAPEPSHSSNEKNKRCFHPRKLLTLATRATQWTARLREGLRCLQYCLWTVAFQHRGITAPLIQQRRCTTNEKADYLCDVVFHAEALWHCKPRFSTDLVVGGYKAVMKRCLWNGTFSVPAECHSSDKVWMHGMWYLLGHFAERKIAASGVMTVEGS